MAIGLTHIENRIDGVNGAALDGANGLSTIKIGSETFVYVSTFNSDAISVFSLNSDGTLGNVQTVVSSVGALLDQVVFTSVVNVGGSHMLLAYSNNNSQMHVYDIANDGTLSFVDTVFDTVDNSLNNPFGKPVTVTIGANTYVYTLGSEDHGVSVYGLSPQGFTPLIQNIDDSVTTALEGVAALTPVTIAGSTYLVSGSYIDNGVSVFEVNSNGTLSHVQTIFDGDDPAYLMSAIYGITSVQKEGATFVYVTSYNDDGLTVFEMASDGTLEFRFVVADDGNVALSGAYMAEVYEIGGEDYLLVTGFDEDAVQVFRVEDDGTLTDILTINDADGLPLDAAAHVAITELDGIPYLLVTSRNSDMVSSYRLDFPITVSYNGSVYEVAESLAGAVAIAEAGSTIELLDGLTLYGNTFESVLVERDNIVVDQGFAHAHYHLENFAFNFEVQGSGDSTISGRGGVNEVITSGAGADTIYGYGGDETIVSGSDDDKVFGGHGNDSMSSGQGADIIVGGRGIDQIYGGGGIDLLFGGRNDDTIVGGGAFDEIHGDNGADTLRGGGGDDSIFGGIGADSIDGSTGRDEIDGGTGEDILVGGASIDLISGGDDADMLFGGSAADGLFGGDGADVIKGGSGKDFVDGDAGKDILFGGTGDDELVGGSGNDILEGQADDDTLSGNDNNDTLFGGDGHDSLFGDAGNDKLTGGADDDHFIFFIGEGNDRVLDFEDDLDTLFFDYTANGFTSAAQFINATATDVAGNVRFDFGVDGFVIVENATVGQMFNDVSDIIL